MRKEIKEMESAESVWIDKKGNACSDLFGWHMKEIESVVFYLKFFLNECWGEVTKMLST